MPRHGWLALVAAIALAMVSACSDRRDPIIVEGGMLMLENQTSSEWRNVVITVNDHFRGGAPSMAAGSRMSAPLGDFMTGFGQKFDRGRMSVVKVEVTARDESGNPVRLEWNGRRPRAPQ